MPPQAPSRTAGETAAVVAHGLLTSMSVVSAGMITLWEHWADLSPEKRDHLFQRLLAHADLVSDGLRELTQGLPEAVTAELAAMERRRRGQRPAQPQ